MRASEWQFLCSVHEQPKSCCAIDYCCHTLDWAANVVTDPRTFPSRFTFVNEISDELGLAKPDGPPSAHAISKSLVNVFRRLHRIFLHAWFQHRSVFWAVEAQSGLYQLFKVVCENHQLLLGESYGLPPEAAGSTGNPALAVSEPSEKSTAKSAPLEGSNNSNNTGHHLGGGGVSRSNTRRHIRGNPSTGSAVPTVLEADEDDSVGGSKSQGARNKEADSVTVAPLLETHDEGEETTANTADAVREPADDSKVHTDQDDSTTHTTTDPDVPELEPDTGDSDTDDKNMESITHDLASALTLDDAQRVDNEDAATAILDNDAQEDIVADTSANDDVDLEEIEDVDEESSTVVASRKPEPTLVVAEADIKHAGGGDVVEDMSDERTEAKEPVVSIDDDVDQKRSLEGAETTDENQDAKQKMAGEQQTEQSAGQPSVDEPAITTTKTTPAVSGASDTESDQADQQTVENKSVEHKINNSDSETAVDAAEK